MNSEALDLSNEALNCLVDEPSDANLRPDALKHLGISLFDLGNFGQAFSILEEALRLFESAGNAPSSAEVRIVLGQICATTGDLTTAVVHFEQARQSWSRLNNKRETALITNNIGVLHQCCW